MIGKLLLQTFAYNDVELPISGATVIAPEVDVKDGKVVRTSQITVRPKGVDKDDNSKNFNLNIYPLDNRGMGAVNINYDDIRWSHNGSSISIDTQSIVTEFMNFVAHDITGTLE